MVGKCPHLVVKISQNASEKDSNLSSDIEV